MSEPAAAARAQGARRGFAVTAGLDPEVAAPLASRCEELGYGSLWSNDHGAGDGLETLAALAGGSTALDLGVAGVDLGRRDPAAIAARVAGLGLDPARLSLALTTSATPESLERIRAALPALRAALPGTSLLVAGNGDAAVELGGEFGDGVLVEWLTPALIAAARDRVAAGAEAAGRRQPALIGYVRAAVGADAETRLARDEGFYRGSAAWKEHFSRLDNPGRTGVFCERPAQVAPALAPYAAALDVLVIRGLAATRLPTLDRIATAAAPALAPDATGSGLSPGPATPPAPSTAR